MRAVLLVALLALAACDDTPRIDRRDVFHVECWSAGTKIYSADVYLAEWGSYREVPGDTIVYPPSSRNCLWRATGRTVSVKVQR
jgi:hypothetical protein